MSTLAPGLARKVKKVLDLKLDNGELLSSLQLLSTLYGDNHALARQQLQPRIEHELLSTHDDAVAAADAVLHSLAAVQDELDEVASCCRAMSSHISSSKAGAAQLLQETERISTELQASRARSQHVQQFLQHYQLTPAEMAALEGDGSDSAALTETFFNALDRMHTIHRACRELLRTHHQRAGIELMDSMASRQEIAYERLCRWVQGECRQLSDADAPEVDPVLQRAVRALRQRPMLFKYCAEEVAQARHNALFQNFIAALTRGGPHGTPRPIEMQAHDPLRYIGDMLAWVHQALASERELLVGLFGNNGDDARDMPSRTVSGVASDDMQRRESGAVPASSSSLDTTALLDRVFGSVCKPIKVRIEQVVLSSPPIVVCYQLRQLLQFYSRTIARMLGDDAQLSLTLRGVQQMAQRAFHDALKSRCDRLFRHPPAPAKDLSPPPQVGEGLEMVCELARAHESSYEAAASHDASHNDFDGVVTMVCDAMLSMCRSSADVLSSQLAAVHLDSTAGADTAAPHVFMLNCFSQIRLQLSQRACCHAAVQRIEHSMADTAAALVTSQHAALLQQCGLLSIMHAIAAFKDNGGASAQPMASQPQLSPDNIANAMRAFFNLVSTPDAVPEFTSIQAPRLRSEITHKLCMQLAAAYESVYSMLDDPRNGYTTAGGSAMVKHAPAQIRTLLGVADTPSS